MNHTKYSARRPPFGINTVGIICVTLLALFGSDRVSAATHKRSGHQTIDRLQFNQLAAELYLPLFWREDVNKDGAIQPDELAVLWGYGANGENERHYWVDAQHHFTKRFVAAYQRILHLSATAHTEYRQPRQNLVRSELAQGLTTLVQTDLSHSAPSDVKMVRHLMLAAKLIERIYARQKGVLALQPHIPVGDTASMMLFYRNQSPFCDSPKTEADPVCNALSNTPARAVGLYPARLQVDRNFCNVLSAASNASQLMDHFSVVINGTQPGSYQAQPYNVAYKVDMDAVAKELDAAAAALGADETAFKNYLQAAAQSFRTNEWESANRAWVAMNATNSKWYARIAPDEVYYEPCAWKAGFALQLARINPDSITWQQKLGPLKNDMEQALATLAGAPYQARDVQFKLPDFIDVVLNAGDQRSSHGATIGQSLPNWGPVAESSGRTVAMTNLYTDADSQANAAKLMSSMFCSSTNSFATTSGEETLITSLLHEAAHNLGPTHEYRVAGKTDVEAFGGPLSSTLEELKAQTSAMFLTDWLVGKHVLTLERSRQIHLRDIAWQFGHISRGMYTADGVPKNYSQLAAIQLGSFIKDGAVVWRSNTMAANGTDLGCLEIDFDKLPTAIRSLETAVLNIKAQNDKAHAERLKAEFVDGKDAFADIKSVITERWLRSPKATFVYSILF